MAGAYVVWTLQAERRLKQTLNRQRVHTGKPNDPGAVMADLNRILSLAFPRAKDLVVHDQYLGFRFRDHEHILLVEVHDKDQSGHYVLKVKDVAALQEELTAWEECRPVGLRHDLVFMTLEAVRETDGRLVGLLYQDAQQFISVDRTASLEEAFLLSVMHGSPKPESLANVLTELMTRVGHLQYQSACPVEPTGVQILLNRGKPIDKYFAHWDAGGAGQNARRTAIAALPLNQEGFFDPVEFFHFVLDQLATGTPARDCVPRVLRGSAHGDLHGRNVLVGIVDKEAHWPALFDYEDMATDNLIGWDFAKLETELKIRAYLEVFAGLKPLDFAHAIFRFETRLCAATEIHRREGAWPSPGGATPEERLHNLLLVVRRLAGRFLGDAHKRPGEWLEELYFLLGCYGVYAGKFENLQETELMGMFLSAGVAVSRFTYSRRQRMGSES